MSSFVVRIDDMGALLQSWRLLLPNAPRGQVFTFNREVLRTMSQWPRIKWFYYCDDQNGNTIRVYDAEHLQRFGGSHYLEADGVRQEHFERVIIRGRNMWSGDEGDLTNQDSLRNQFRNNPAWRRFSARRAPLRSGMQPPAHVPVQPSPPDPPETADIQRGMSRNVRLWYFEKLNQLPDFNPVQNQFVETDGTLWEYTLDNRVREGSVPYRGLLEMLANGHLQPSSMVHQLGATKWVKASRA